MRRSGSAGRSAFPPPEAVRLLFDEQLLEELVTLLADLFPGSLHVRSLGAGGTADEIVWHLARDHGCVLVTKEGLPPAECPSRRSSQGRVAPDGQFHHRGYRTFAAHRADDLRAFHAHGEATLLELG